MCIGQYTVHIGTGGGMQFFNGLRRLTCPPISLLSTPSDKAQRDEENGIYILLPSYNPCRAGKVVCLQTTMLERVNLNNRWIEVMEILVR